MLSVIRELAEEAEARAPAQPAIGDLLVDLVRRGEAAVARTPEQLQVLRDAGVVDAGGAGLLELVRGIAAAVSGEALPEAPAAAEAHPGVEAIHQELSRYRYCTVFLIEGRRPRPRGARGAAREDRRLAARRRRLDRDQGARAHRRSRRGALDRQRSRHDRPHRDREHARPDAAAGRTAARSRSRRCRPSARPPASSRSSQEPATVVSSRASPRTSARSRSSRVGRR